MEINGFAVLTFELFGINDRLDHSTGGGVEVLDAQKERLVRNTEQFVAGTGGRASGLAYRILESGYQLQIPRMFAALVLISAAGIGIFLALSLLSHLLLRRWHESALKRET